MTICAYRLPRATSCARNDGVAIYHQKITNILQNLSPIKPTLKRKQKRL
ncbi:hypothetical protein [Helicobacter sp. T3_23-1056]